MSLLSLEQALAYVNALPLPQLANKTVPLHQAVGRVLAQDLYAYHDLPPFDASAMDGYALRLPVPENGLWQVVGRSQAGEVCSATLAAGQAWRIFTGAPVPAGSGAVLAQEHALVDAAAPEHIRSIHTPKPGQHIRLRGSEQAAGELLLPAGTQLEAKHIGMLAAQGHAELPIYKRPTVGVLSSGDELAEPGAALQAGQIYDANRPQLLALVHACGCTALDLGMVADDLSATQAALQQAAGRCDFILSSGGASVGDADYLRQAISASGQLDFWKLAIKPGKPLALGQVHGKPIAALPGNPVAAFVTFHLLLAPLLRRATGLAAAACANPVRLLPLAQAVRGGEARRQFLRAQIHATAEESEASVSPLAQQGSAALASLAAAQALLEIPEGASPAVGELLRCYLL
jgi:molybdopterin molybdotransferase